MLNGGRHTGFSLVEILLSMVITVLVVGAIHNILRKSQRLTSVQGEQIALQSSVRAGALILREELGGLSTLEGGTADQNDVVAAGPSAITYRAQRGFGFICQVPTATTIRIARGSFSGYRDPQAGRDAVSILVPGDPEAATDDSWLPASVVSVSTSGSCPLSQGPGISLTLAGAVPSNLPEGTPVRITEIMELKLYRSGDQSWLGARSVSSAEAIQPLIGPLVHVDGFQLEYLDGRGVPTADRTDIKSIRGKLRGISAAGENGAAPSLEEELVTQITLRNWSPP